MCIIRRLRQRIKGLIRLFAVVCCNRREPGSLLELYWCSLPCVRSGKVERFDKSFGRIATAVDFKLKKMGCRQIYCIRDCRVPILLIKKRDSEPNLKAGEFKNVTAVATLNTYQIASSATIPGF
jgi:hypothetical protein